MRKLSFGSTMAVFIVVGAAPITHVYADSDYKGSLTVALENDLFGGGSDKHYTHGSEISYVSDTYQPAWLMNAVSILPFYKTTADTRLVWSLGQQIYTPANIETPIPDPTDRPYAGWLYMSLGLVTDQRLRSHYVDKLELVVGVVGPDSGAESVQKTVHKWVDSDQPQGWDHQLHSETTIDLQYQREWMLPLNDNNFDIVPRMAATLGTARRDVGAGFTFRLGSGLDSDFGPPLIRPAAAGMQYFKPKQPFYWYLFAGAHGRYVEHNIFLDGNTHGESPSVDKESWVGEVQGGFVLGWENWRVTLTEVVRTREFKGQEDPDEFGALSLSYRF